MIAAAIVAALLVAGCSRAPQPVVAATAPAPAAVSRLRRDINSLLAATSERATWGVLVKSLATDDTLYALNPRKLLLPASNVKLATLAAAADRQIILRDGRVVSDNVVGGRHASPLPAN